MQYQRDDKACVLPAARYFREEFLLWLHKLRNQLAEAAMPQLVPLEPLPAAEEALRIQYRGAELKLPAGVSIDAVAAILRSIQSL